MTTEVYHDLLTVRAATARVAMAMLCLIDGHPEYAEKMLAMALMYLPAPTKRNMNAARADLDAARADLDAVRANP